MLSSIIDLTCRCDSTAFAKLLSLDGAWEVLALAGYAAAEELGAPCLVLPASSLGDARAMAAELRTACKKQAGEARPQVLPARAVAEPSSP
jgi:hypothetical protein